MDRYDELLRTVGRIEAVIPEFHRLSERVEKLEAWQSWLKGGWAALVAAWIFLSRGVFGK